MGCLFCPKSNKVLFKEEFDYDCAYKVADIILEDDVDTYKQFRYTIKTLKKEEFKNLFNGNVSYEYTIYENKKDFKYLAIKFENFHSLLEEWYQMEDKYKYLKILWKEYPCIPQLREILVKDKNKFEEALKPIGYSEWEPNIKDDLRLFIRDDKRKIHSLYGDNFDENSKARELINIIKQKNEEIHSTLKLSFYYLKILEKKNLKNENYINNLGKFINDIIMQFISFNSYIKNENFLEFEKLKSTVKYISNEYKNRTDFSQVKEDVDILSKIGNADFQQRIGKIFNITIFKDIVLILKFIHLIKNILDFDDESNDEIFKGNEYQERLNQIKSDFYIHQNEINKLFSNNFEKVYDKIQDVNLKILQDKESVMKLIKEIENSKEKERKKKKKNQTKLAGGIALAATCVVAGSSSFGIIPIISGLMAFISGVSISYNMNEIKKRAKNINEYRQILSDSIELSKKIDEAIDNIKIKINNKLREHYPNYYNNLINEND